MAPDCLPHQVRCHVEAGADCPAYYVDVYYEQPAGAACEGPAAEFAAEVEGAHEGGQVMASLAHVVSFSWSGDG